MASSKINSLREGKSGGGPTAPWMALRSKHTTVTISQSAHLTHAQSVEFKSCPSHHQPASIGGHRANRSRERAVLEEFHHQKALAIEQTRCRLTFPFSINTGTGPPTTDRACVAPCFVPALLTSTPATLETAPLQLATMARSFNGLCKIYCTLAGFDEVGPVTLRSDSVSEESTKSAFSALFGRCGRWAGTSRSGKTAPARDNSKPNSAG